MLQGRKDMFQGSSVSRHLERLSGGGVVMVNFMCQHVCTMVLRCLVKHYFRRFCEGIFG